jgi:hypothetical protein
MNIGEIGFTPVDPERARDAGRYALIRGVV